MSFAKLSAFSLASFELQAQTGGTLRYAEAIGDLEDQISLSPQAMGLIGTPVPSSQGVLASAEWEADE